jgi:hypothetical protein
MKSSCLPLLLGEGGGESLLLKNCFRMSRATNLECADNGGALDFLALSRSGRSKAASRYA